jgi:UDP-N-acetyl-D-mannosaminuronate dehydrogenase
MKGKIIVVGLGEIGKPLLDLISEKYETVGVDIDPVEIGGKCEILHICYPFQIDDFVGTCVDYIEKYRPSLTIINSTVATGTSRRVYNLTGKPVTHSPVRGKHTKMRDDLLFYTKFIGGIDEQASRKASEHFKSIGLKTKILSSPEAAELAKLTETTYFAHLISWAQEVERYCTKFGLDYDEVVSFYEEIHFFPPVKYLPGVIGGHCVMPNVKILKSIFKSGILDAIERSNEMKANSIGIEGWENERQGLKTTIGSPSCHEKHGLYRTQISKQMKE